MNAYVLKEEKNKVQQEVEDRKIDRRYHWFIFMFIVVLGLAVFSLALSYLNGAFERDEGFFGFDDTVKNIVWTVFTALFIFWALLVSIIRVREAYYEAEDYKAFARLSVVQFFYLWANLLVLLFVLASATVMLLFPNSSGARADNRMDAAFALSQDAWLGISPFFVFYLLAFFSYCYLVFMLSFGYVKDLEIFESGKNSKEAQQIKNIEIGLKRVLERLENASLSNSTLTGYSPPEQQVFSGIRSNPIPAVANSGTLRTVANSLNNTTAQERARSLFSSGRQPNTGPLPTTNPFVQAQPVMPNSPLAQNQSSYATGPQSQVLPHVSAVSQNPPLVPNQVLGQSSGNNFGGGNNFSVNNNFSRVGQDRSLDSRFGYSSGLEQIRDSYYNVGAGPSRVSQEWMANSLNTLSLPQPIRGAGGNGVVGSQVGNFNTSSRGSSSAQSSWDELLGTGSGSLRGRRRIR